MAQFDNQQMLPIGTMLKGGEYRVERYIASGGFGNTYEVEHVRLGKRMALKEFFMRGINLRQGSDVTVSVSDNEPTFRQMKDKFYKEAQRLARLQEVHIVEVNDFFEENSTAYYVMRLIEGESLSAAMRRTGRPLSEQQVRHVLPQVLQALRCVHSQGLYHLDLKPANIMQNADGHCWLIDFGASKQLSAQQSMTLSTSTGLCYTPGFAPAEQIEGSMKRIGPWTDIYALGATLYNLLSGELPPELSDVKYDGERAFHFPAGVSADMRRLVLRMMRSDYPERPQSVDDVERLLLASAPQATADADKGVETVAMPRAEDTGAATVGQGVPQQPQPQQPKREQSAAYKVVNFLFWAGVVFSVYILLSLLSPSKSTEIWIGSDEIHTRYNDILHLFRGDGKNYYYDEMKMTLVIGVAATALLAYIRQRLRRK